MSVREILDVLVAKCLIILIKRDTIFVLILCTALSLSIAAKRLRINSAERNRILHLSRACIVILVRPNGLILVVVPLLRLNIILWFGNFTFL